ncbi:MAG: glycosyltransferase family 2 protein [Acidobacteriaceae bacterium]|nr:glycosyltransferase family 2 protein [Acidobacteriaceae bacterium]
MQTADGASSTKSVDGAPEALVIDNNPSDDSTEELVARFPVRYCRENRPGLNWGRARAVRIVTSELLLYTDDGVVLDRNWAAQMRVPFADPHVSGVKGAGGGAHARN